MSAARRIEWPDYPRFSPHSGVPRTWAQLAAWVGVRMRIGDVWRDSRGWYLTRNHDGDDCGVRWEHGRDVTDCREQRAVDLHRFMIHLARVEELDP